MHCIRINYQSPHNKHFGELVHFHILPTATVAQYFFYTAFSAHDCNQYHGGTGKSMWMHADHFVKGLSSLKDMITNPSIYIDEVYSYEDLVAEDMMVMKIQVDKYINGEIGDDEFKKLGLNPYINMPINVATDFNKMEENRMQIRDMLYAHLDFPKLRELTEENRKNRILEDTRMLQKDMFNDCILFRAAVIDRMRVKDKEIYAALFGTDKDCFEISAQ